MCREHFSQVAKKHPVLWYNFAHSLFSMSWFLPEVLSSSEQAASSLEISGLTGTEITNTAKSANQTSLLGNSLYWEVLLYITTARC